MSTGSHKKRKHMHEVARWCCVFVVGRPKYLFWYTDTHKHTKLTESFRVWATASRRSTGCRWTHTVSQVRWAWVLGGCWLRRARHEGMSIVGIRWACSGASWETWGIVEEAGGLKLGWLRQVVRALKILLSGSASNLYKGCGAPGAECGATQCDHPLTFFCLNRTKWG